MSAGSRKAESNRRLYLTTLGIWAAIIGFWVILALTVRPG